MSELRVCPECRTGKHQNCDGTAWDNDTDAPGTCTCTTGEHPRNDGARGDARKARAEDPLPSAEKDAGLPRWGDATTRREFGLIADRTSKGLGKVLVKTYRHLGDALDDANGTDLYVMHRVVAYSEWMHLGDLEDQGGPCSCGHDAGDHSPAGACRMCFAHCVTSPAAGRDPGDPA